MKEYRDHYFLKAKRENYPARSVYKLKELDAKFKLFRQGMRVLDLGAAPGSWSLGAAEKVGQRGLRHPDHGDRLSAAGHLHAGGRVQPFRCL